MKNLYIFLAVLLCSHLAVAQITIVEASLPKVGDVLEYQIFNNYPNSSDYSLTGENIEWQFDGFNVIGTEMESYTDISMTALADSFPEANMLLDFGGFEAAGLRTQNTLELLGINLDGFGGIDIGASVTLSEPFVLASRPLDYGDQSDELLDVTISFATENIPFLDSLELPLPGATLDSIRVITMTDRAEEVVGWGTATVFNETKEVLQVKRTELTSTSFEIGVTAFGFPLWLPADDLLAGLGGGAGMGFGGEQTEVTYLFLSDDLKSSVVEFTENEVLDTLGNVIAVNVTGRITGDIISSITEEALTSGGYYLYPNPSADYISIANNTTPDKERKVELYNISGQKLIEKENYKLNTRLDISDYQAGQYIIIVKEKEKTFSQSFVISD